MTRITREVLNRRAVEACKAAGLEYGFAYRKNAAGENKAVVGRVALDYNPINGGYNLDMIVNEGGACKSLNGWANRLKSREMLAFLDGMIVAGAHKQRT